MHIVKARSAHSGRLERWLGTERITELSGYAKGWYGPPIHLLDCPGSVKLGKDGDFTGPFERGVFYSAADAMRGHANNLLKQGHQKATFGAGFASAGQALAAMSGGLGQMLNGGQIAKTGPTQVVASAHTLWRVGTQPAAGSAGAAAPGGTVHVQSNTGAMVYTNPSSGTLHLVGADFSASVINNAVMVYDRLFSVAKTINSTATQAVTGVPTRYQNTTPNQADSIGGNFLFIETGATAMAATGHNWTTCTYTDDAGNATQTLPSLAGISGCIADRLDMPLNSWFAPLASGDIGIKGLSQMQASAAVATGSTNFVIGHPIGIMAFPIIHIALPFDWLTNRNLAPRIFDNACLAMLVLPCPATTATTYQGTLYAANAL